MCQLLGYQPPVRRRQLSLMAQSSAIHRKRLAETRKAASIAQREQKHATQRAEQAASKADKAVERSKAMAQAIERHGPGQVACGSSGKRQRHSVPASSR